MFFFVFQPPMDGFNGKNMSNSVGFWKSGISKVLAASGTGLHAAPESLALDTGCSRCLLVPVMPCWCNPCAIHVSFVKWWQYVIIWLLSQMLCHLMRLNVSILGWSGMVVEALASFPCTANEPLRSAAESVAGGDRSNWAPWAWAEFCSRCSRLSDNQLKSWLPMIWSIYI